MISNRMGTVLAADDAAVVARELGAWARRPPFEPILPLLTPESRELLQKACGRVAALALRMERVALRIRDRHLYDDAAEDES